MKKQDVVKIKKQEIEEILNTYEFKTYRGFSTHISQGKLRFIPVELEDNNEVWVFDGIDGMIVYRDQSQVINPENSIPAYSDNDGSIFLPAYLKDPLIYTVLELKNSPQGYTINPYSLIDLGNPDSFQKQIMGKNIKPHNDDSSYRIEVVFENQSSVCVVDSMDKDLARIPILNYYSKKNNLERSTPLKYVSMEVA